MHARNVTTLTEAEVCSICLDPARQGNLVCIVEDIRDLLALEATGQYRGKYHVLGGVISPMDGIGPHDLNIASLMQRLELLNTTPGERQSRSHFRFTRDHGRGDDCFLCVSKISTFDSRGHSHRTRARCWRRSPARR